MTLPRGAYYENGHPVDPATPKFTDAEIAKLAAIEAAPAAEESVRERVARAIWEADNPSIIEFGWDDYPFEHDEYCRMADAAIAVLRGPSSDAERAVERCLALADELVRAAIWRGTPGTGSYDDGLNRTQTNAAHRIRAAVAGD